MSLFGQTKRHTPSTKPRRSPLPIFTPDPEKKFGLSSPSNAIPSGSGWFTFIYLPLPRFSRSSSSDSLLNGNGFSSPGNPYNPHPSHSPHRPKQYVRVCLPISPRLYARIPRLNTLFRILLSTLLLVGLILFLLGFRKSRGGGATWSPPFVDPNTLILTSEELAMVWEWEVLSGHYPTVQPPPDHLPLASTLHNPAVPEVMLPSPSSPSPLVAYHQRTTTVPRTQVIGVGPERHYISIYDHGQSQPGFPARPSPGSVLDLDAVLEKCDLNTNQYVRDCLEFLRIGGGLDLGRRVRRGNYLSTYKQIYFEEATGRRQMEWTPRPPTTRAQTLSRSPLQLDPPFTVPGTYESNDPCDPLYPRIFHMFWVGPFTDKPYMAVVSFLFTQNLGLDLPIDQQNDVVRGTCRPQLWVWINPGPAAAVPNPSAKREMYEALATNPWASPFLHERFRDVVKFKMWNTTEQLDGVAELKPHWRDMPIFNSGGNTYKQAAPQQTPVARAPEDEPNLGEVLAAGAEEQTAEAPTPKKKDTMFEKVGTTSKSDYDRLSVILSDMARFILTHRFGGIYLDADTIFLRDWEELWNYRGNFAYRWSWHQKYNTAVLKLHKGSALSTFLFKTALENGLDFHPMTVSRYLKDAGLEKLLFRVPDAVFDPAWLNMEGYQRERPPFPYFQEYVSSRCIADDRFSVFFSNDRFDTAGAQPLGFDGFFRGAFSYHFHNFWWLPFDPSRNFPDLGPRFAKGEKALRDALKGVEVDTVDEGVSSREDMDDEVDLSWATVLKRTFEAYIRAERPNAYGEELLWESV